MDLIISQNLILNTFIWGVSTFVLFKDSNIETIGEDEPKSKTLIHTDAPST